MKVRQFTFIPWLLILKVTQSKGLFGFSFLLFGRLIKTGMIGYVNEATYQGKFSIALVIYKLKIELPITWGL